MHKEKSHKNHIHKKIIGQAGYFPWAIQNWKFVLHYLFIALDSIKVNLGKTPPTTERVLTSVIQNIKTVILNFQSSQMYFNTCLSQFHIEGSQGKSRGSRFRRQQQRTQKPFIVTLPIKESKSTFVIYSSKSIGCATP